MRQTSVNHSGRASSGCFRDLLVVSAIGLVFRLLLLNLYPVPYGEDAFGRLYFRDQLFLSHWLPVTQGLVVAMFRVGAGVTATRFLFALIGALAGAAFWFYLRQFLGRTSALFGSLLFTLAPLFTILSLMPYQELPFLGLLFTAFGFLGRDAAWREGRQLNLAAIFFGLACLTRYESWFLIPFLFLWNAFKAAEPKLWVRVVGSALRWGWAPASWLLLSRWAYDSWDGFLYQTADSAFYAAAAPPGPGWMAQYALRMLYWVGLFGSPLVGLAVLGVVALFRKPGRIFEPLLLGLGQAALAMVFYVFVLGPEQDTVFRFAALPITAAILLSALGVQDFVLRKRVLENRLAAWSATFLMAGLLALYSAIPVARLNQNPIYKDPHQIARFLAPRLHRGQTAIVIADRARNLSDAAPLHYQRIAAQVGGSGDFVFSSGNLTMEDDSELLDFAKRNGVRYMVVFGFDPWLASDRFFSRLAGEWGEVVMETETARVFQIQKWPAP